MDSIIAQMHMGCNEVVSVPEWGGDVLIRGLSASERLEYEDFAKQNPHQVTVWLVAHVLIAPDGSRLFSDDDFPVLERMSSVPLRRIRDAASAFNCLSDGDVAGQVERLQRRPERRFAYRLALALGRPNVDGMLAEMTSLQYAEWIAYSRLEPWGEDRDDLRMGIVASVIANSNRGKGQKPFKPQDFMPDFEPVSEEAKIEQMIAKARKALGGRK